MSFIETPAFPQTISYGAVGGPEYKTDVVEIDSGYEQRNVRWSQSRNKYKISMPLTGTGKDDLIAWFRAVKGRGHGFRLKDWSDYLVTVSNGRMGTSPNGAGAPANQLTKYYATGALDEYRLIRKPIVGTVQVFRGGVLQTAGVGAGNYALDTTTGIVTFVADATANVTNVSIASNAVITLSASVGVSGSGKLYLSGITGSVGTVLNGIAHTILGGSTTVITIATSTLGLAYVSGGTAGKYAQPTEALTWSGQFDVPVRFDADYLGLLLEGPPVYRGEEMLLTEIRV